MRIMLLSLVVTALMAGTVHAGPITFTFDDLLVDPLDPIRNADIEAYMETLYPSDVTVSGSGRVRNTGVLGPDTWIGAYEGVSGLDYVTFTFALPIGDVSFDWATWTNSFVAEADGVEFFSSTGPDNGHFATYTFASPVSTLRFQSDAAGYIGIDNLTVTAIPAPGALLLSSLGMGLVGWFRRRQSA